MTESKVASVLDLNFEAMSEGEREALRVGVRGAIEQTLESEGLQGMAQLMSDSSNRQKLAAIFGKKEAMAIAASVWRECVFHNNSRRLRGLPPNAVTENAEAILRPEGALDRSEIQPARPGFFGLVATAIRARLSGRKTM